MSGIGGDVATGRAGGWRERPPCDYVLVLGVMLPMIAFDPLDCTADNEPRL